MRHVPSSKAETRRRCSPRTQDSRESCAPTELASGRKMPIVLRCLTTHQIDDDDHDDDGNF
ncbi:hypothetical protein ACHAXS_004068 [Conticribra weissflogii]